jgi:hypothetical protein
VQQELEGKVEAARVELLSVQQRASAAESSLHKASSELQEHR